MLDHFFLFLVGESWCKKRIPIESKFGEIYDQANSAVTNVGSAISSKLITEVSVLAKALCMGNAH